MFDAYLRSKCTIPDIYTFDCADLVLIRSLRTALGSLKEEEEEEGGGGGGGGGGGEEEEERRTWKNNSRGRRFQFTTLETSASFAKGIFMLRTIA